tara:strand:- start:213 stop:506 length:294 start_codon:yes stop_codon:yes gene_type:complete
MSAQELQKQMYHIQSLCEDLKSDLEKQGAPDFDSIRSEVDSAESEWDNGAYEDAVSTLDDVKDKIDEELNDVGDLDAREEIVKWIDDMPTRSFMDYA